MTCDHCPVSVLGGPCPPGREQCDRWEMRADGVVVEADRPDTPTSYPPPARQAANLAHALRDWAVSGFPVASHEEQRRRMNLCVTCPEWDPTANRCRLCGCFLAAKLTLLTEHCPIGKW